jgi:5-methyltetrahydrofolate--homocysteine methyltransferase
MADFQAISAALQAGKADQTKELVQGAIDEGASVADILEKGLISGMSVIGEKFKKNEVYVPEVLIAARAMNAGMSLLEPLLVEAGVKEKGIVVIGTVKGDLHDIGKNLVAMMLKGGGYKVVDVGIDVDPAKFVETAKSEGAQVMALSALLTTTMPQMENVIKAVKEAGISVKVMIGGAPVTQKYADEIGADGYAPDAASAVDLAQSLIAA